MSTRNVLYASFWVILYGAVCGSLAMASDADEQWQKQMLFAPTDQQLQLEQQGRVLIYSGIKSADIVLAMDSYFERIDNMMFINTVQTNKDGEPIIDSDTGEPVIDDDC
jgi:hypothetical protein